MGTTKTLQDFITTQSVQVPVLSFVINLIVAAGLAFILSIIYTKFGSSISNRKLFARNFMMITMTTMLVISIVKASLALSLGLVGALSIVRFRAAIKEPEELAYLFLSIAIGLGLGADQTIITMVAFAVITGIIWIKHTSRKTEENHNLYLTVTSHNPHKTELSEIVEALKKHCSNVSLKRFDETKEVLEASFVVGFDDFQQLNQSKAGLQNLNESIKITFLDNNGVSA